MLHAMDHARLSSEAVLVPKEITDTLAVMIHGNDKIYQTLEKIIKLVDVDKTETSKMLPSVKKDVSELSVVNHLKVLGSKREDYHEWNVKLINALARVNKHPEIKELVKQINTKWAKDAEDHKESDVSRKVVNDFHDQCDAITTDENGPFFGKALTFDRNELYKKRNEDLEFILIDKTEGESAAKVRKRRGEGLVAYYLLHRWFVKTTGPALQEET